MRIAPENPVFAGLAGMGARSQGELTIMFGSRQQRSPPSEGPTVGLEELRVGMFIHLEGGWLSHPFAMSSFRIANAQQIATLRGLKFQRIRWSPELSELAAADESGGIGASGGAATAAAQADSVLAAPASLPAPAAPGQPASGSAEPPRTALAAERAVQQQCERQFAEAAAAWRRCGDAAAADPAAAGAAAQALAATLTDKLVTDGEMGIRLLPQAGNDRAAAHALNVTVVSMLLARSLGVPHAELAELALGALMHDLGKFELPERVRHLEAGASAAETSAYRDHVARGVALARRMALPEAAQAVLAQHHEHADASGFPQRLAGERITLAARIVAIVNRYDNLCNPATRMPPLTPHEAVAMLFAHGRTRYDAAVLNAFIRMMGVYPAGSLVQLTDERYAMVVAVNSSRPLKPRVLVHESGVPRSEALLLDLEQHPNLGIRRSLTAARMPAQALQYLDPRPRVAYFFEPLAQAAAGAGAAGGSSQPVPLAA